MSKLNVRQFANGGLQSVFESQIWVQLKLLLLEDLNWSKRFTQTLLFAIAKTSVCTKVVHFNLSSTSLSYRETAKINPHSFLYFQTSGLSSTLETMASSWQLKELHDICTTKQSAEKNLTQNFSHSDFKF